MKKKNPEVFYGQVLTNFSFSEFCITDLFHHNKFQKPYGIQYYKISRIIYDENM
jgi:hypothetical protein